MQVPQRVTCGGGPVHHDSTESVLDGRLETTLTALVDVHDIGEGSEDARQTGEPFDTGARPGLVERRLQRLGPGLERVRSIRRGTCVRLAFAFAFLSRLFQGRETFVVGSKQLAGDLGRLQLHRQLLQAQLMVGTYTIRAGEPFGQSRDRLPSIGQPGQRCVVLSTGAASIQRPCNLERLGGWLPDRRARDTARARDDEEPRLVAPQLLLEALERLALG